MNTSRILFVHGSDSNGNTYKAQALRKYFPKLHSPDFTGPLAVRLAQMESIIKDQTDWTVIGSSLGGLMAALFTARHPEQIRKLVLMAPALNLSEFSRHLPKPIDVPTILIIGKNDDVIPINRVEELAKQIFLSLQYLSMDDDHRLHHATDVLDWKTLLA